MADLAALARRCAGQMLARPLQNRKPRRLISIMMLEQNAHIGRSARVNYPNGFSHYLSPCRPFHCRHPNCIPLWFHSLPLHRVLSTIVILYNPVSFGSRFSLPIMCVAKLFGSRLSLPRFPLTIWFQILPPPCRPFDYNVRYKTICPGESFHRITSRDVRLHGRNGALQGCEKHHDRFLGSRDIDVQGSP